ncbi:MAG: tetratricopeptide repeat protein, partial [Flavobacterium sp.]|nr:tetratricopeptide repeat protein [Flavobacterium sp.]
EQPEESIEIIEEVTTAIAENIEPENLIQKEEEKIEDKLEIGKPITFSQKEKHSFEEWLQITRIQPIDRTSNSNEKAVLNMEQVEKPKTEDNSKKKKIELIDKFIESNPKITPAREVTEKPVITTESSDSSQLMTETLARVYLEQKKYQKAIQAYEILILKYPEKSIFFADRIKDIKILQQNNQ